MDVLSRRPRLWRLERTTADTLVASVPLNQRQQYIWKDRFREDVIEEHPRGT
jgi:hypothetical protein